MPQVRSTARDGAVAGLIAAAGTLLFALVLGIAWNGLPRLGLAGLIRPGGEALAVGIGVHLGLGAGLGAALFKIAAYRPAGALVFSLSAALFCVGFLVGQPMAARTAAVLLAQHLVFAAGLAMALPATAPSTRAEVARYLSSPASQRR